MTSTQFSTDTMSASPAALWAGRLAMVLALVGCVWLCAGDPMGLMLPGSVLAVLLAAFAFRGGASQAAGANIGLYLGILNIILWIIVVPMMRWWLGVNVL